MRFKILFLFILLLALSSSFAQQFRLESIGGMKFSVKDIDNSLTPFDFAGNPAWLVKDADETYLRINPSISNSWGNYHRYYNEEGKMIYSSSFLGVKTLGEVGTFLGFTAYNYEIRRNFNRSLKKNPYSGEAFFFVDTTAGQFRYNGPEVRLMYSYEVIPKLCIGASVYYQILDGLKKVYTNAKTIYRDVNGNAGLAYQVEDNFIVGAYIDLFDTQESIEAQDVNLNEVEVFKYRGETFKVYSRGNPVNHKVRTKGESYRAQLFYSFEKNFENVLSFSVSPSRKKILVPYSSYDEFEEGHSSFYNTNINFVNRSIVSDELMLAAKFNYNEDKSWSRLTSKNTLIWEWRVNTLTFGIGSSYYLKTLPLLIAFEYELSNIKTDSSKYIDKRSFNQSGTNHNFRLGFEHALLNNIFLRAGINYSLMDFDLIYGGNKVNNSTFTLGAGIPINEIVIDFYLKYEKIFLKNDANLNKSSFGGFASIKLKTF